MICSILTDNKCRLRRNSPWFHKICSDLFWSFPKISNRGKKPKSDKKNFVRVYTQNLIIFSGDKNWSDFVGVSPQNRWCFPIWLNRCPNGILTFQNKEAQTISLYSFMIYMQYLGLSPSILQILQWNLIKSKNLIFLTHNLCTFLMHDFFYNK